MSNSVVGVVDNSYSKSKVSKAGKNFNIHYIEVDGVTVSTGFNRMFEVGEHIDITVEEKFKEWQFQSNGGGGKPAAGAVTAAAPVAKGNFGGGKRMGSFPVDLKDGQMSIIRQSSMNRAVEILATQITHGIISFDTPDDYMAALMTTALEITDFSSGNDITKLKASMKEVANG